MLGEWDSAVPLAARGDGPEGMEAEEDVPGQERGSACHFPLTVKMLSLFLFHRDENKRTCLRNLFPRALKKYFQKYFYGPKVCQKSVVFHSKRVEKY